MTTKRRTISATRAWVLCGLLVAVVVLGALGRSNVTPAPVVRAGDEVAASVARFLTSQISAAIAGVEPSARPQAAESWLRDPVDTPRSSSIEWVVGDRDGARIPLVIYSWWENKSFSAGYWGSRPYWGRSCQVVTVTSGQVTSEATECPAGTPDVPWGN